MKLQIVTAGRVAALAVVPDSATLASDGSGATWDGGAFAAPTNSLLMAQAGAGVGWALSDGVLSAPPPPALPAATVTSLRGYAFAKVTALLATPRSYSLPGGLAAISDASAATGIDLQGLLTWGTSNPTDTANWVDDNGGVVTLTGAQCVALAQAVLAYGQSVYAVLATAMNGIANETITTTTQLDALSWPA